MNKFYQIIFILFNIFVYGQEYRVGINTETPEATLHIKEIPIENLPEGRVQGVSFPNFTTEQRDSFTNMKLGTMIYNTTLQCLEIYTKVSGSNGWHCLSNTSNQPTPNAPRVDTKIVKLADILPKQNIMFRDEEGDKIFNRAERGFFMGKMLQITNTRDNKTLIKVKNFLPHNFKNVKIYYQTGDSSKKPLNIVTFEEIPALSEFEEQLSFDSPTLVFEDEDGVLTEVKKSELEDNRYNIPLIIKSEDTVLKKLETIKHFTHVSFYDYGSNNSWKKITPRYAREYLPVIANMAYLYSSDKFKQAFMDYEYRLYDNNGRDIDREAVYQNFFAFRSLAIGVVNSAEGLASLQGNDLQQYQFGVNARFFDNKAFYQSNNDWPSETWAHEYGHVLGFNHASNMTYKSEGDRGYGYVDVIMKIHREMLESKELPFSEYPFPTE